MYEIIGDEIIIKKILHNGQMFHEKKPSNILNSFKSLDKVNVHASVV